MAKRVSIIGSDSSASTLPGWNDFEFQQFERSFLTEGVIEGIGGDFEVTERGAGANMSVDVAAGRALIEITNANLAHSETYKVYFDSDAVENLAIEAADPTNPRKDRVVLRVDVTQNPDGSAGNIAVIEVLAGTPDPSPSAPATPSNAISLAIVDVPASDTAITDNQITDDRGYAELDDDVLQDVAREEEAEALRNDTPQWGGTSTGSSSAYAISVTPTKTAYAAGQRFSFIANHTNDGAATLNVDGIGAVAIQKRGQALIAGDIPNGSTILVMHDGTNFQMLSPSSSIINIENLLQRVASTSNLDTDTNENTVDSVSLGANTLAAGDRISVRGVAYVRVDGSSGTWTLRIKLGATTLVTWTLTNSGSSGSTGNAAVWFDVDLIIRTTGGSGTGYASGVLIRQSDPTAFGTRTTVVVANEATPPDVTEVSIDTTTSNTLSITSQFGSITDTFGKFHKVEITRYA